MKEECFGPGNINYKGLKVGGGAGCGEHSKAAQVGNEMRQ